ncbi:hypothetical protein OSTOST_13489 [Ostertagia ostertagi]
MAVMVLRLAGLVGQLVEQRIAFRAFESDDPVEPVGIEVERLAAGLRVRPHQRMLDVGSLGDLLGRAHRRPVTSSHGVVAVDRLQTVDALARRLRERLEDRMHVAEPGRAAAAGDLDTVQQRRLGRHREIGIVGVPVLGADRGLVRGAVGHQRADHHRDVGHRTAALVAQELLLRLAERPGEFAYAVAPHEQPSLGAEIPGQAQQRRPQHLVKPGDQGGRDDLAETDRERREDELAVHGEPDRRQLHRQDKRRRRDEGDERGPGRKLRQPGLEAGDPRQPGDGGHRDTQIVEQHLLEEHDRRGDRHEQEFEGAFQVAFHRPAN